MARRRLVGLSLAAALVAAVTISAMGWRPGAWHEEGQDVVSQPRATATTSQAAGDNGVTNGAGSEVIRQPEGAGSPGLPGRRTTVAEPTASLLGDPAPRTASRRGALVAGFPVSVVPVLPGSAMDSSGVSSTRHALEVSIVASSRRSPDAVLAFYRRALAGHDFVESAVPVSAGAVASGFDRGADHLVVTTSRAAGTTSYSVFGSLHTAAHG